MPSLVEAATVRRFARALALVAIGVTIVFVAAGSPRAALASPAFWALMVPGTLWWTAENLALKQDEPKDYRGRVNTRLLQGAVTMGLLVGAIDHYRLGATQLPAWTVWVGAGLILAGGAIRVAAIRTLDRHFRYELRVEDGQRLVESGLYARVRHPSYLGILLVAAGYALAFASALGALVGAGLCVATLVVRIRDEERVLRDAFGPAFDAYAARTWRLVPYVY